MNYYDLVSIINSSKSQIPMSSETLSFFHAREDGTPYIKPTLEKEDFPVEKPAILLISAVAASGKSTTARALSRETGLPILDLAKHKAVGDNTLTGVLTTAYPSSLIGNVLQGLSSGTHGVIIDGIDEGRSKTTEQGFEAFLENLITLSNDSPSTSIVIFGRSQALLSAWAYLGDRNASVGLARINPFGIDQAKAYIDAYAAPANSSHRKEYEQSRDHILKQLGSAFSASSQRDDDGFLSFIGYPPVLDAIATLLTTERNYHRLNQAIESGEGTSLEVRLLVNIASYLLTREQKEKALPNFITQITSGVTKELAQKLASDLYDETEQCARVLSRALGVPFPVQVVQDRALSDKYEKSLDKWCPEHPFLAETRVRNPVFEAVAITKCALSKKPEYQKLANDYVSLHRSSYHLLYIMSEIASGSTVNPLFFNALIQSSSDFISKGHGVSVDFSGLAWDEEDLPEKSLVDLDVKVYSLSPSHDEDRTFTFSGELDHTKVVVLGPNLPDVSVTVPSQTKVIGKPTIECSGACHISAATVEFESQDLIIRSLPSIKPGTRHGLYVHAGKLIGHTEDVETKGADLVLLCEESHLSFPLAKYTRIVARPAAAPEIMKKYRRLRRILSEFVSHSKGGLAKFRAKIEHERVLRGELGRSVLNQLLEEGVLYTDPKFYYVNQERLTSVIDLSWHQMRQYQFSDKLRAFLLRVR